jgi:hypothetical protein
VFGYMVFKAFSFHRKDCMNVFCGEGLFECVFVKGERYTR